MIICSPGIFYELLHQHDVVIEGLSGFSSCRLQLLQEVCVRPCNAHSLNENRFIQFSFGHSKNYIYFCHVLLPSLLHRGLP